MELTEFEKKLINEETGELTDEGLVVMACLCVELTKRIVKILIGIKDKDDTANTV